MNNKYFNSCVAILLICLWFSGCASFPDGKLQEIETLPAASAPTSKAKLNVIMNYYFNGNHRTEFDDKTTKESEKIALETLQKSGYFSSVDTGLADPDLDIKIKFKNQEEGSFLWSFISGFTFLVLPTSGTNTIIMDAEVLHLKTGETRTYHLEDSVDTYLQILLIFIMPFNWPGTVFEDVMTNMYNHLIVKMQEDGLLNKAQIKGTEIETVYSGAFKEKLRM